MKKSSEANVLWYKKELRQEKFSDTKLVIKPFLWWTKFCDGIFLWFVLYCKKNKKINMLWWQKVVIKNLIKKVYV